MEKVSDISLRLGEYIDDSRNIGSTLFRTYLRKIQKIESICVGISGSGWVIFMGRRAWKK